MNDEPEQPPRRTSASEISANQRRAWGPGWIWAVPIAAVGIVLWLTLRVLSTSGTNVTVVFDQAAGMSADSTEVEYRGLKVGSVTDVQLDHSGQHVIVKLNIDDSVSQDLVTGTQFYLEGASPSLSNPASLKALISGPTITMVPGKGKAARHYIGIEGPPPKPFLATVRYRLHFSGAVGGLTVGAPVTLRGFTVGDVASVKLTVNADTGNIATPVTIVLDPTRFHIRNGQAANGDWAPVMNAVLTKLVQNGLRASLTQSPPLIGAQQIVLKTVPNAAPASLDTSEAIPEIPVVSGNALGDLVTKLGKLPIGEIGDNVRTITARLKLLVGSPKLQNSLDHLDDALASLDQTLHAAGPQVAPMIKSLNRTSGQIGATAQSAQKLIENLRQTSAQIDATAQAAQKIIGGGAAAPNGNLQQALDELTQAARAMRTLANYLDQHPEALIQGR